MKWIKLIITILEWIGPFLAKAGKNRIADELEIAKGAIVVLTKDKTPEEKGRAIEEVVGRLKAVKDFKSRVSNRLDKAKDRLWKKVF